MGNNKNESENIKNVNSGESINEKVNSNEENKTENCKVSKKQKSKIGKILGIIGKTLGIIIIVFTLVILGRIIIFKKFDVFGVRFYQIMSGSMEPTIHVSDLAITNESKDLSKGDIIAFEHAGSITVHRIVDIIEDNGDKKIYQTKGDNNNANDPYTVPSESVRGKYLFKIPGVGNIIQYIQRHLIIIVGAIVVLILVYAVIKLILK